MSIVINNREENPYVLVALVLIVVFAFMMSVSSPIKVITIADTIKARAGGGEIVANSITWTEFQQWMIFNDTTIYHEYNYDTYHCVHFSNDLQKNAQSNGMTIYRAVVWIDGNDSHSINYGCFINDSSGEPVCALINPQTGEIFFEVEDYIHSEEEWNIISIIIKKGTFGENEKSIKRIY